VPAWQHGDADQQLVPLHPVEASFSGMEESVIVAVCQPRLMRVLL
jgi:hypothetical protein